MAKKKSAASDANAVRNHPNNPSNQSFNISGNKTGKKGWWRNA